MRRPSLLLLVLLACSAPEEEVRTAPPVEATRPNLLFVFSDDHAAHAIGAYGSEINRTPNIDRLAAEGVRFANCFGGNSICGPSRATILTGLHSHANGFRDNCHAFVDFFIGNIERWQEAHTITV